METLQSHSIEISLERKCMKNMYGIIVYNEILIFVIQQEHAEFYVQMMLQCGLRSAMEPDLSA